MSFQSDDRFVLHKEEAHLTTDWRRWTPIFPRRSVLSPRSTWRQARGAGRVLYPGCDLEPFVMEGEVLSPKSQIPSGCPSPGGSRNFGVRPSSASSGAALSKIRARP